MAEARARKGGWVYAALALLALGVFLVVNRASSSSRSPEEAVGSASVQSPAPDRSPLEVTIRPVVSTRLAPRTVRGIGPHCEQTMCCPTRVSTFGVHADISRVIAFFQRRGFQYAAPPLVAPVSGDPRQGGTYLRWLGELPGDAKSWRLVNVVTGSMNEHPNWETVFQVSRTRCRSR